MAAKDKEADKVQDPQERQAARLKAAADVAAAKKKARDKRVADGESVVVEDAAGAFKLIADALGQLAPPETAPPALKANYERTMSAFATAQSGFMVFSQQVVGVAGNDHYPSEPDSTPGLST